MAIPMQTSSSGPWEDSTLTLEELQATLKPFLRKLPPDPFSLPFFQLGEVEPQKQEFRMMMPWWSAQVIRPETAAIIRIYPVRLQVKCPRSKKRRIRAKWAARPGNWA